MAERAVQNMQRSESNHNFSFFVFIYFAHSTTIKKLSPENILRCGNAQEATLRIGLSSKENCVPLCGPIVQAYEERLETEENKPLSKQTSS